MKHRVQQSLNHEIYFTTARRTEISHFFGKILRTVKI